MDQRLEPTATALVTQGYTIRLDTDSHVILARPIRVNHILHLILSIVSILFSAVLFAVPLPLWAIVWLVMILRKKEELYILDVVNGQVVSKPMRVQQNKTIDLE